MNKMKANNNNSQNPKYEDLNEIQEEIDQDQEDESPPAEDEIFGSDEENSTK